MGPPIRCDVDMADLLRERVPELDEGCASEDEMLLEGDAGTGEGDEDGEREGAGGSACGEKGMRTESSKSARKRQRRDSVGTISDLSDAPSTSIAPKRSNHRSRYRSQRRRKQRAEEQQLIGETSKTVARKHRAAAQPVFLPKADTSSLPVNSTGFGGRRLNAFKPATSLESLKKRGYVHVTRVGKEVRPLVDRAGRIVGLVYVEPRDEESWDKVVRGLERGIEEGIATLKFTEKQRHHRRGKFAAVNVGFAYGGGRKRAGNIFLGQKTRHFMDNLLRRCSFKRWSGFVNQILATYNPHMHEEYRQAMDHLRLSDLQLKPPFANSVFAALAVNFSKKVESDGHTDDGNKPDGWCVITSAGRFDAKRHGQIVLDQLRVVVDFPRGTSVYIPSAVVTHYNLPIAKGETHHSMTQYTGGGLFRWLYNGCCTDIEWFAKATQEEIVQREKDRSVRWRDGLKYFPLYTSL